MQPLHDTSVPPHANQHATRSTCGLILLLLLSVLSCPAQQDSTRTTLQEVHISGVRTPSPIRAAAPTQVLKMERIEQSGAMLLSDAIRQMAGITLRDYGGVGGIKTVSARGLGSQFSTLTIDGVAVNDCQNGQVDLGRYMLGNSAYISFSNGVGNDLLQTARAYAAGNTINMETQPPTFRPSRRTRLKADMEAGSFGLLSPALTIDRRLGKSTTASLWVNHLRSRGDYPFTLFYTGSTTDSSSRERRTNSQMHMTTVDAGLHYAPSARHNLSTKLHFIESYHALPGPVRLYTIKASEHSEENLIFAQTRYRFTPSARWNMQVVGKYQRSYDLYEDTAANTLTGRLLNDYTQQEGYASAAVRYRPTERLQFGLSTDAALSNLNSNLSTLNHVERTTWLTVLSAAYTHSNLQLTGNLLANMVGEHANRRGNSNVHQKHTYRNLSPYIALSFAPLALLPCKIDSSGHLRMRYFFKQTYRVPNFNEMYYFTMTRNLKPEQALQHGIGFTISSYGNDLIGFLPPQTYITFTADAYYNQVENKIVAIPSNNMFLWSMDNLGKVDIHGLDVKTEASLPFASMTLDLQLTYSYQHAVDHTTPGSKEWGNQITYTPRHSGGIGVYLSHRIVDVGYTATLVGDRYYQQQNTAESLVPGYVDQGITLSHAFRVGSGQLAVRAQILNLMDVQYSVIRSYPMMGRNYRIKITYEI